jgi:Putative peptidoglycan binding domain
MGTRSFAAGEHPHVPAGSSAGGQFAPTKGSGGGGGKKPAGSHPHGAGSHPHGSGTAGHGGAAKKPAGKLTSTLAYDPKHKTGPGYGSRGGDPHVHELQRALNRLGLTDGGKRSLAVDGKLGPRTTESIKAAQKRLGLPADGKVTPELYQRLLGLKALPTPGHHRSMGGDMTTPAGPGPAAPADADSEMEQHLEDLLGGLPEDEIAEITALVEAMHANGGM